LSQLEIFRKDGQFESEDGSGDVALELDYGDDDVICEGFGGDNDLEVLDEDDYERIERDRRARALVEKTQAKNAGRKEKIAAAPKKAASLAKAAAPGKAAVSAKASASAVTNNNGKEELSDNGMVADDVSGAILAENVGESVADEYAECRGLESLKVAALKEKCKAIGVTTSGVKAVLVSRLRARRLVIK